MTTHRTRPRRAADPVLAAVVLLAALAGPALGGQDLYRSYDQPRPETKTKLVLPFELTVTLGDLWYLQSSEKAKGTGEQISQPGFRIESWYAAMVPSTVLGTRAFRAPGARHSVTIICGSAEFFHLTGKNLEAQAVTGTEEGVEEREEAAMKKRIVDPVLYHMGSS